MADEIEQLIEHLFYCCHRKRLSEQIKAAEVAHHDILIRDHMCPVRLLNAVDQYWLGEALQGERVDEARSHLPLI